MAEFGLNERAPKTHPRIKTQHGDHRVPYPAKKAAEGAVKTTFEAFVQAAGGCSATKAREAQEEESAAFERDLHMYSVPREGIVTKSRPNGYDMAMTTLTEAFVQPLIYTALPDDSPDSTQDILRHALGMRGIRHPAAAKVAKLESDIAQKAQAEFDRVCAEHKAKVPPRG